MDVPTVPLEQVRKLLQYRYADPLEDALHEYADYLGKPFEAILEEYRHLEATNYVDLLGPDIHLLCLMLAPLQLSHLLARLQIMLGLALPYHFASYLDIGAGSGRDCIAFARCGFKTTSADIPWEGMDFAQWRYAQRR
ncbi:MAG TPA: hypothetical protein VKU00_23565, partial [Chthonomonadaceae bacterium]|nr:hypothetical protein [Chthonomonadaceae bacterium]